MLPKLDRPVLSWTVNDPRRCAGDMDMADGFLLKPDSSFSVTGDMDMVDVFLLKPDSSFSVAGAVSLSFVITSPEPVLPEFSRAGTIATEMGVCCCMPFSVSFVSFELFVA